VSEGVGLGRERFQNPDRLLAYADRDGDHRANAEGTATLRVYARIVFGVVAAQQSSGPHALARESGSNLQFRADGWNIRASGGATDHEFRIVMGESDGRPRGMNQSLGARSQQLEGGRKICAQGF